MLKDKKNRLQVNELKVGSILSYVNLGISCIIPLFYTPIMLRMLGQAEYGLYSLSNSVVGYLTLLNFGMGSAVIQYITKCRVEQNQKKLNQMVGLFLFLYTFFAVLVCIAGTILRQCSGIFFGEGLSSTEISRLNLLIFIMTLTTAISFPSSVYAFVLVAHEKYIFRKVVDGIGTIMAPVLNLIVLLCGYATIGMAIVALGVQIFYLIIFAIFCARRLDVRPIFRGMPLYMLKEIGVFSAFIFLSSIVDMLYWATDKVLIGAMVGSVAVAVYNIGGTFTTMLQNMSSAISGVFGTRVTSMVLSKRPMEEISDLLIRIGRLQYLVVSLLLSGYIVFGKIFIQFWAGSDYQDAYYIGLMTMIPITVPLIQSIAFSTIVAQNKHRFRSIIYAGIAVVNVVSTYLVIPQYGILGAAACTGIAYIVGNGIIMNIYYYKVTKLDIPRFWINIIKMSIVPFLLIYVSIILITKVLEINSLMVFMIYVMIYTCIFVVLSWKFTMNDYEKKMIKDLFYNILKRINYKR